MNQYQDMLEKIFDEQRKLVEYLEADRYPKRTEERVSALMTAIIHEAIELQDLTSWKWWKRPSGFEIIALFLVKLYSSIIVSLIDVTEKAG